MILVTEATGLSGSIVIREFARQKEPVRALIRNRAKARVLETFPTVEIVEGDMLRPETLEAALHGVDRVLLISSAVLCTIRTAFALCERRIRAKTWKRPIAAAIALPICDIVSKKDTRKRKSLN